MKDDLLRPLIEVRGQGSGRSELIGGHTDGGGHLAPLQHHVFGDASIGVDVDALVLVAQQHLHAVRLGQNHDGVGGHLTLNLPGRHTGGGFEVVGAGG